ncbi:hypothetical protein DFH27DRAFT_576426 [Peziza echinospora]|nr:hypothetical protein DFH27DRAFT_576426 [Peziza echinospora]
MLTGTITPSSRHTSTHQRFKTLAESLHTSNHREMSSFANSLSTAKESNNTIKNNTTPSNVGQGGGSLRSEGVGIGEWPVRVNGNTTSSSNHPPLATRNSTGPRRPSLSTTLSHHPSHHNHNYTSSPLTPSASSNALNNSTGSIYLPPHHYNTPGSGGASNGGVTGPRAYSRDEMVNIYKSMSGSVLDKGLQEVLSKRSVDGESGGGKDILQEVCWVENGGVVGPVALEEMTQEEKELFAGNINSPQKQLPLTQNNQGTAQNNRDHNHQNINSPAQVRKNTGPIGLNLSSTPISNNSTTPIRGQNIRRNTRENSDGGIHHHNHTPSSPAHHNTPQPPPPSITRRRTDHRGSLADAFGGDLEKDKEPAPVEKKDGPTRPNFGRWGSLSSTNPPPDRFEEEHHDAPTPTSATVGRSMGLFRRGSAAWGTSSVGPASGGITMGMNMAAPGGGAAAFNNGTFGGAAGFALSGGVPSSSASNSADKKIGSKSGGGKGDLGEKSAASSVKSHSGDKEFGRDLDTDRQPNRGVDNESDRQQDAKKNTLKEEDEENDLFEPDMGQTFQRYQYYQDSQQYSRDGKVNADEHGDRPMSSDTDPYGRRESIAEYLHSNSLGSIKEQQLQSQSISAAIGAEQSRLKTTSPFSHTSGGASSVSTPTRGRGEVGFGARDYNTASGLGGLHSQLRDLDINQQNANNQGQGSRMMNASGSQEGMSEHEPLSPTETNPYQSPVPEKEDDSILQSSSFHDDDGGYTGLGGLNNTLGGLNRKNGDGAPSSDRSGRSSATGFGQAVGGGIGSGLGNMGLGNLGGSGGTLWGTSGGGLPLGTPDRLAGVNNGPGSFFGNLGNDGSLLGGPGSGGYGSMSRASKLGALFMEPEFHQQHQHQQHHGLDGGMDGNDGFDGLRMAAQGGSMGVGSGRRLFAGLGGGLGGSESPMRDRGDVHELFSLQQRGNILGGAGDNSLFSALGGNGGDNHLGGIHGLHGFSSQQNQGTLRNVAQPPQPPQAPGLTQPQPQPHAHALVMPDKIQWEYRDPQGVIQGPFSGLEMHDWFKGGYFPQDLHVKRTEDEHFEPLSFLIRRIGNQREPFLVPLQGVVPLSQGGPSWGPASGWSDSVSQAPGTVQPPFANSFPSFGTTLTADQQNALERRKQEEQFLMARQREFLVQQQLAAKQAHVIQHQQLHHIHPQPGLGAIQAPISGAGVGLGGISAFGSVGAVGPIGGGLGSIGAVGNAMQQGHHTFEPGALLRQAAGGVDGFSGSRLDDVLAQHSLAQNNLMGSMQQPTIQNPAFNALSHQQNIPIHQQQHHLQAQQAQQQFHLQQQAILDRQRQQMAERQAQEREEEEQQHAQQLQFGAQSEHQQVQNEQKICDEPIQVPQDQAPAQVAVSTKDTAPAHQEVAEQAAKKPATPKIASPVSQARKLPAAAQSPWQQNESSALPTPFPPPPGAASKTGEPLSINVSGVARASPVETPHTSTSVSIAPWAQKVEESAVPKGPSLKEIQEMEAKQAAALAEVLAEQARKDAILQQNTATSYNTPAPQVGLPSTATWASSSSAATTPGNTALAWGAPKPLVKSATIQSPSVAPKKTLQQIQKEEEAKKAKSAQQAAATQAANAVASLGAQNAAALGGKRYADLAGKQPATGGLGAGIAIGGAWTTVGAGGKKTLGASATTPATPATPNPLTPLRSMPSTGAMGSFGKVAVVKQHPNTLAGNTTAASVPVTPAPPAQTPKTPAVLAQEEFMKWCRSSLKALNSNVNQEDFLQTLLSFPTEAEIISDSIYANSSTMDGNRFAEEFIRRRRSAQQGVVVEAGGNSAGGSGGWNEVAAKAGRKETTGGVLGFAAAGSAPEPVGFKVVPGKKKGRK